MGSTPHRKIRAIKGGALKKYSKKRKWSEKRTIFVTGPSKYGLMNVVSETPFIYEGEE